MDVIGLITCVRLTISLALGYTLHQYYVLYFDDYVS